MEMQQKPFRKLDLKKKTISKLSQQGTQNYGGDSWTTIIYQTAGCLTRGCATDITRTSISINPPG